ncbi:MAG: hypothetical protein C4334_01940 [Pyrinomonas sp.]|uniref:diacylglycerol/lipid kinase family protein n=1 Tax=Pyrinomonas sp. TaxID=2080306 RepID=UPI0033249C00
MDSPLIIVNRNAAQVQRAWPQVRDYLRHHGIAFDVRETARAGDAQRETRRALNQGRRLIAVLGGDGTTSEAAAGFFEPLRDFEDELRPINREAALALLPAGTGDDFARGLVGHRASLNAWLARLAARCREGRTETRTVDVICAECADGRPFVCLNAVTVGFGAEVCARVAAQSGTLRRLPGEVRFTLAALAALNGWHEVPLRVAVDAEVIECRSNLIAVTSGPYAGGGMMLAPMARSDDGALDVMLTTGVTRKIVLRELPRTRDGAHLHSPVVRMLRGERVEIEPLAARLGVEADGDLRGTLPLRLRVVAKALRIVF